MVLSTGEVEVTSLGTVLVEKTGAVVGTLTTGVVSVVEQLSGEAGGVPTGKEGTAGGVAGRVLGVEEWDQGETSDGLSLRFFCEEAVMIKAARD